MTRASRGAAWILAMALAVPAGACSRHEPSASADPEPAPVVVKADTEGLLLTWIDDKGDFHVETSVGDVPIMGRDAVRVVDSKASATPSGERVSVVDLRTARADGSFPVRTMTRADFEAIAVARREKSGPTLASAAAPSAPPPPAAGASGEPGASPAPGSARPVVVVYGAEWCGACHDAARWLKAKGIPFVEKDVEKDPDAAREMQTKLAKNGLRAGSIPVIDVRGKVMVGFNAHEIEGALGQAL